MPRVLGSCWWLTIVVLGIIGAALDADRRNNRTGAENHDRIMNGAVRERCLSSCIPDMGGEKARKDEDKFILEVPERNLVKRSGLRRVLSVQATVSLCLDLYWS